MERLHATKGFYGHFKIRKVELELGGIDGIYLLFMDYRYKNTILITPVQN
jgi:hypothetical protein